MLFSPPPQRTSDSFNRQTLSGGMPATGNPGLQSTPITPGTTAGSNPYLFPGNVSHQLSTNPLSAQSTLKNSTASYNPAPPTMTQFTQSPNNSTLIRTLLGKVY